MILFYSIHLCHRSNYCYFFSDAPIVSSQDKLGDQRAVATGNSNVEQTEISVQQVIGSPSVTNSGVGIPGLYIFASLF